ncbi:hypothetical protein BDZ89DRAFT_1071766, partial [Hymenopellis radicata]
MTVGGVGDNTQCLAHLKRPHCAAFGPSPLTLAIFPPHKLRSVLPRAHLLMDTFDTTLSIIDVGVSEEDVEFVAECDGSTNLLPSPPIASARPHAQNCVII